MSGSSTQLVSLITAPTDPKLLAAIGKIAICHGHLDHILRMTLKTLLGVSRQEALDATARQGSSTLRQRVKSVARKKFGEGDVLVKIEAILEQSRQATERRNELLHSLWAKDFDGKAIVEDETHHFSSPSVMDLESLADRLAKIAKDLNTARVKGFLKAALESRQ